MKFLTIIASGITLMSSYSVAMEKSIKKHSILLCNNMFDDGIIGSVKNNNVTEGITIPKGETKIAQVLPQQGHDVNIIISTSNQPTKKFVFKYKMPLPKRIEFNRFSENGYNYIQAYAGEKNIQKHECK